MIHKLKELLDKAKHEVNQAHAALVLAQQKVKLAEHELMMEIDKSKDKT